MAIREPVVAGTFYDSDPGRLKEQLKGFFSGAGKGSCTGVVSPHAGYAYSGRTAAHAIGSLKPAKRFIILGPNHTGIGRAFSIMPSGAWKTPLGTVDIDPDLAGKLMSCPLLEEDGSAHLREHSIEAQLPLLQHRFGEFSFVPICMMNMDYSDKFLKKIEALGNVISGIVKGKDIGVVASSDFSHYLPLKDAETKDSEAIKHIRDLDLEGFFRALDRTDASICGFGPIAVMMAVAKNLGLKAGVIHHSTSGDVTGDTRSVVSYYAIGFE